MNFGRRNVKVGVAYHAGMDSGLGAISPRYGSEAWKRRAAILAAKERGESRGGVSAGMVLAAGGVVGGAIRIGVEPPPVAEWEVEDRRRKERERMEGVRDAGVDGVGVSEEADVAVEAEGGETGLTETEERLTEYLGAAEVAVGASEAAAEGVSAEGWTEGEGSLVEFDLDGGEANADDVKAEVEGVDEAGETEGAEVKVARARKRRGKRRAKTVAEETESKSDCESSGVGLELEVSGGEVAEQASTGTEKFGGAEGEEESGLSAEEAK